MAYRQETGGKTCILPFSLNTRDVKHSAQANDPAFLPHRVNGGRSVFVRAGDIVLCTAAGPASATARACTPFGPNHRLALLRA